MLSDEPPPPSVMQSRHFGWAWLLRLSSQQCCFCLDYGKREQSLENLCLPVHAPPLLEHCFKDSAYDLLPLSAFLTCLQFSPIHLPTHRLGLAPRQVYSRQHSFSWVLSHSDEVGAAPGQRVY